METLAGGAIALAGVVLGAAISESLNLRREHRKAVRALRLLSSEFDALHAEIRGAVANGRPARHFDLATVSAAFADAAELFAPLEIDLVSRCIAAIRHVSSRATGERTVEAAEELVAESASKVTGARLNIVALPRTPLVHRWRERRALEVVARRTVAAYLVSLRNTRPRKNEPGEPPVDG